MYPAAVVATTSDASLCFARWRIVRVDANGGVCGRYRRDAVDVVARIFGIDGREEVANGKRANTRRRGDQEGGRGLDCFLFDVKREIGEREI